MELWRDGNIRKIVQYNECDAITTYLLWLRTAHFCGLLTSAQYRMEENQMEEMLAEKACLVGNEHLQIYLKKWREMRQIVVKMRVNSLEETSACP